MLDVFFLIDAFGVNFRIAGAADAEIISAFLNLTNEVNGIAVIPFTSVLIHHFSGDIAPESKNVLYISAVHFGNSLVNGFLGRRNAG